MAGRHNPFVVVPAVFRCKFFFRVFQLFLFFLVFELIAFCMAALRGRLGEAWEASLDLYACILVACVIQVAGLTSGGLESTCMP